MILHVPLWLQVCCTVSGQSYPAKEYPTVLFIGWWPHSFHRIVYLYSICLVSTTCCDATITNISVILTYCSYVLFLIHSWYNYQCSLDIAVVSLYSTCIGTYIIIVSTIVRGEPEWAPNTRVTYYSKFTVPMYESIYVYVCSDTSSMCSRHMHNMPAHYIIMILP